jgi:hypothetical protein
MIMKKALAVSAAALVACALSLPAAAQQVGVSAGIFSKGRAHFVATAGTGSAFDEDYLILGVGVNYFLVDGLSVGLAYEAWTGGDPNMSKITPSVQYVFYQVDKVKPYVGAFFRRTNIDNLPNLDSTGARGGVYLGAGRNLYIGIGGVYESYLDCTSSTYRSCDSTYAEVTFTFAF